MKRIILLEILRKLKERPDLARKVKIAAAVGFVGIFITLGLVVWAGVAAVGFVADKASTVIQSPQAQVQMQNLTGEVQAVTRKQVLSCWNTALSLIAIEPWIAHPVAQNLTGLINSCLGSEQKSEAEASEEYTL